MGILGGIGSGKTSVVRRVTGFLFHIIDADKIGHTLLSDTHIQSQLKAYFGDTIFSDDATVSRSALAARVFGDTPAHESGRIRLNEILHPAIRKQIHSEIDSVSRDVDAVILDAALLLEGGWDATCNWLIFIDTPLHLRQQRVQETRNWSAEELARREASQWSIEAKKGRADFVIDNSGSIEQAAIRMQQVFQSLLTPPFRTS